MFFHVLQNYCTVKDRTVTLDSHSFFKQILRYLKDSHGPVRNNAETSPYAFTNLPPVITSFKPIVPLHKQGFGREDPLEKGIATHSSILAWRIPRTEEAGGLQSMGLQRV